MNETIAINMPLFFDVQIVPFILLSFAVAILIIGHLLRLSLRLILSAIGIIMLAAFVVSLNNSHSINEIDALGLSFKTLSTIGIQFLLPASFMVMLMVQELDDDYHKKTLCLLLLLVSTVGAMVTLMSANWIMFFIGVQCMSLPVYGLLAFNTDNKFSLSSSIRYLLLSAAAMSFMLFGILLLYAGTGHLDFFLQGLSFNDSFMSSELVRMAMALILVGIGFKLSLFPFHIWAPEVYQGAPFFVVTYMIAIVKAVMVIFLLRLFLLFGIDNGLFTEVLTVLAIASMWIGNGLLLRERNFLRLFAYLSIGHLGYLIIPILAQSTMGIDAIFLDISAFGLAILLVFAASHNLPSRIKNSLAIDDLKGLFHDNPFIASILVVSLISIAGFPLTAGFIGKYAIFLSGIDAEKTLLIIHMLLSSIFSIFALARIIVAIFQKPLADYRYAREETKFLKRGLLLAGALSIIALGIFPDPWFYAIRNQSTMNFGDEKPVALHQKEHRSSREFLARGNHATQYQGAERH